MKIVSVPNAVIVLLLAFFPTSVLLANNFTNKGNGATYNLSGGDTLFIQQGTYTGNVTLGAGAVIVINTNAGFSPSALNLWAPTGKIINNGTATVSSMGIGGGFSFENNATLTVNGDMSFYSGAAKALVNNAGAKITITGALSANDNTTITNLGTITVSGAINLYAASSVLTNKGSITAGGSFNNQGQVTNETSIRVAGDFNYWGGQLNNSGLIEPNGTFSIGAGLTYVNSCRMVTKGGIANYGTLQNYGLIWAGTSGTAADQFTNSGNFFNNAGAKLRTVTFTNYGNIIGAGYLYATGVTTLGSGATIGVTGTTADTIKVYDVTRSNPSAIFDNQWGTVRPNTKYATFMAPDSIEIFAGCSAAFRSFTAPAALPVVFNYFYLKTISTQPVLYWSAEFENNMKFQIERSFDGSQFSAIATTTSNNSAAYSFTDVTLGTQTTAYYRIKGISAVDGSVKYTAVQIFQSSEKAKANVTVYPNPAKGAVSIAYNASSSTSVLVRVQTMHGQQILLKNLSVAAGANRIEISETANLAAGIYTIELVKGNEIIATEKFVKQ